jgi:hypothetical protein
MLFFDPIAYAQYVHQLGDYSLIVERRIATREYDVDVRITKLWIVAMESVTRDPRY